jgi:hypothetical protein
MKILGYAKDQEDATAVTLSEVLFEVSPDALREVARFFAHAASEMERMGETYDHIHFQDACNAWSDEWPEIVVIRKRA